MSRIALRFVSTLSLIVVLGTMLAACGGSPSGSQPVTVKVTLTDFKVESSLTTFAVGTPYRFEISNTGSQAHEVVIMAPATDAAAIETNQKSALLTVTGQDLPAGGTKTVDYTFTQAAPAGTLEFACHLPGHYEAGMHLPIVVK